MLLQVVRVSRSFGGLRALHDVSLEAANGEIVGLIGPNGAGKTTLLNIIAGAQSPDHGEVRLEGRDVTGLRADRLCRLGISRTFQIARAFPHLTALENVKVAAIFGGGTRATGDPAQQACEILDFVEFSARSDILAVNLNAAQLKRLDLARALASRPRLLLLDEIFAGLTPTEVQRLVRLLHAIRVSGVTLLVVEHLVRVIMQECTRVVVLCSGEKIAEGPPEAIARDTRVVEAYLGHGRAV